MRSEMQEVKKWMYYDTGLPFGRPKMELVTKLVGLDMIRC